ncbi:MAG: hypothetical protein U1G07_03725 [Verrucomicrobiota bacterium]
MKNLGVLNFIGRSCHARVWAMVASLLATAVSLSAQLIIDLPEINLQPDQAHQTFEVYVQNPDASRSDINGIQFNIQTADGGPQVGGVTLAPKITDVDLTTGSLFQNNNGYSGSGQQTGGQIFVRGTLTSSGTVTIPNGTPFKKIATVEIDTTGFFGGVFSMTLDTLNGPTRFTSTGGNVFPTLIDGSITIVPEVNATGLVAGALILFSVVWKLRRAHSPGSSSCS